MSKNVVVSKPSKCDLETRIPSYKHISLWLYYVCVILCVTSDFWCSEFLISFLAKEIITPVNWHWKVSEMPPNKPCEHMKTETGQGLTFVSHNRETFCTAIPLFTLTRNLKYLWLMLVDLTFDPLCPMRGTGKTVKLQRCWSCAIIPNCWLK